MNQQEVIVIGGGLGGLASACVAQSRGYRVRLFEANDWVGGKAAELRESGFRFDMGPTILTMPSVLERIFAESGRDLSDYLDLVRLDPQWRCFFEDGSQLDLREENRDTAATIGNYAHDSADANRYLRFMDWSRRLNQVSQRFFFYRSVGGMGDMFEASETLSPQLWGDIMALRMGKSVASSIRSYIKDPRVAQLVDHFTQYVGSCPENSPSVLCGIADMQTNEGVWYPLGGTRAVPFALETLARELGVQIETGAEVAQLLTGPRGEARGVELLDGRKFEADYVISNRDVVRTMIDLQPGDRARDRFLDRRSYEPACSGVVLYLGLRKRYDHIAHHNFVFSQDPHLEFGDIYGSGKPASDPTLYVCAPAVTEPAVAPEGGEALYILVHTPYLRDHHDWSQLGPSYRQVILDKLKRVAGMEDIEERIVSESMLTPQDIHDRYRVLNGAIYGLASHGTVTGAFKPSNRSEDVEGLYFAGGSAHPGPGMPMALMSGWIAANALDSDHRKVSERASEYGASFRSRFDRAISA